MNLNWDMHDIDKMKYTFYIPSCEERIFWLKLYFSNSRIFQENYIFIDGVKLFLFLHIQFMGFLHKDS